MFIISLHINMVKISNKICKLCKTVYEKAYSIFLSLHSKCSSCMCVHFFHTVTFGVFKTSHCKNTPITIPLST